MTSPPQKNRSYDPHRSRDSVSPVCGIFSTESALCHILLNFCFVVDKEVELVVGGTALSGAYPV